MPNLSKKTIRLLRQVERQILAEPHLYDQSTFADSKHPCTGACCIAGWVVWNKDPKLFEQLAASLWTPDMEAEAARILSLRNAYGLFGTGYRWPRDISKKLFTSKTRKGKAEAGAAAIEAFIKADGAPDWNAPDWNDL